MAVDVKFETTGRTFVEDINSPHTWEGKGLTDLQLRTLQTALRENFGTVDIDGNSLHDDKFKVTAKITAGSVETSVSRVVKKRPKPKAKPKAKPKPKRRPKPATTAPSTSPVSTTTAPSTSTATAEKK